LLPAGSNELDVAQSNDLKGVTHKEITALLKKIIFQKSVKWRIDSSLINATNSKVRTYQSGI